MHARTQPRRVRTGVTESDLSLNRIQDAAILQGLSPEQLNLVLRRTSLLTVPKGVFLFRQGEPANEMFLLESGRVRLHETTANGRELLIRFVRAGEVFGDKAAIIGAEFGGSAVSDSPVRTYAWTSKTIVALLGEVPRLATNLFTIANQYLHYSRERYRMLATAPAERRIRWALKEFARSFGSPGGNTRIITGRALQQDIADLAITTIYTVNRVLRTYEQRGILTRKRGCIVLLRPLQ
jgi:CRP-like cAMP-binding protein